MNGVIIFNFDSETLQLQLYLFYYHRWMIDRCWIEPQHRFLVFQGFKPLLNLKKIENYNLVNLLWMHSSGPTEQLFWAFTVCPFILKLGLYRRLKFPLFWAWAVIGFFFLRLLFFALPLVTNTLLFYLFFLLKNTLRQ